MRFSNKKIEEAFARAEVNAVEHFFDANDYFGLGFDEDEEEDIFYESEENLDEAEKEDAKNQGELDAYLESFFQSDDDDDDKNKESEEKAAIQEEKTVIIEEKATIEQEKETIGQEKEKIEQEKETTEQEKVTVEEEKIKAEEEEQGGWVGSNNISNNNTNNNVSSISSKRPQEGRAGISHQQQQQY
ncbi:hypothetical protein INT46_006022 [Mucor plumbeus]|uniref:Uncharacterized protein n=1 Tax=Mucor plumbeus TaxID=97098 RepID=A0A8H7RL28_9FUNG|nr:hypothetical protein INT46_006022 [Mucor plumbeus]